MSPFGLKAFGYDCANLWNQFHLSCFVIETLFCILLNLKNAKKIWCRLLALLYVLLTLPPQTLIELSYLVSKFSMPKY